MASSIFWYDYETTGINPRCDRPMQVAGIRTDEQLNEIGEPLNLYCRLADDILPHPAACRITGITPAMLAEKGLCEAEFMTRVHAELATPGTCGAGYNSLRFDDEMTRHSLYRNFFDPYAREWQGGNSRWDLIDLVRTAYALRPEGIEWPQEDGRVSLKLERLTAANGIVHGRAHDALSDVRATIALARLIRQRQPRLYDYLYRLRSKVRVLEQIQLLQPLVHVSGRYAGARHYLAVVLPLAWHPTNRNALIVCDLQASPDLLLAQDAAQLRQRLYTRRDELGVDELPVPLKLLHVNRCPVVAPMSVLRAQDQHRLQLDMAVCEERATLLRATKDVWQGKLADLYAGADFVANDDPEQQLYDGFLDERDHRLCEQMRLADPMSFHQQSWPFSDPRLVSMLTRYRARNFPEALSPVEQDIWKEFCRLRLSVPEQGAPNTLPAFRDAMTESLREASAVEREVLLAWQAYAEALAGRYGL
jgi:exodeoxyribonuclease-1